MTPVEALQAVLAGEHAAVHLYAVLGGRIWSSKEPALASWIRSGYTTHRARRDQVHQLVRELGGQPVVAEVSYELDGPAATAPQVSDRASELERRLAAVYAQAVASTVDRQRRWAIDALTDAAVRSITFGGEPSAFPGADEL